MSDVAHDEHDSALDNPQIGDIVEQWWAGIKSRLAITLDLFGTEATLAVRSLTLSLFVSVMAAMLFLVAWILAAGSAAYFAISLGSNVFLVLGVLFLIHIALAAALLTYAFRLLGSVGFRHSRDALRRSADEELTSA